MVTVITALLAIVSIQSLKLILWLPTTFIFTSRYATTQLEHLIVLKMEHKLLQHTAAVAFSFFSPTSLTLLPWHLNDRDSAMSRAGDNIKLPTVADPRRGIVFHQQRSKVVYNVIIGVNSDDGWLVYKWTAVI